MTSIQSVANIHAGSQLGWGGGIAGVSDDAELPVQSNPFT